MEHGLFPPKHTNMLSRIKYVRKKIKIQVYVAITTFCMVAIMQHKMKLIRSTFEILQILNLSLTDTTPLVDLLNKTNFQDVKD